ncbi:MAG TPA: DUF1634 domain-containing protein [Bacteroidales bacterium]
MFNRTKPWNDEQMSTVMGTLLRVGVVTSALIVVLGAILFFFQHPGEIMDYTSFKGEPQQLRQVHSILIGALSLRGRAVIQLGLLLLIATPVARVLFSLIGFVFEKDWIYMVITFIVLLVLLGSLFSVYL